MGCRAGACPGQAAPRGGPTVESGHYQKEVALDDVAVIPAKAGIHSANPQKCAVHALDPRFRGNDRRWIRDTIPNDTTTEKNSRLTSE
jgi:hypothetical protein